MDKSNFSIYRDQVDKTTLLSPDEEKDLLIKAKNGDKEARNKLIESNLRLVVAIANKYKGMGIEYLDLIQQGNMGLCYAVDKYDPSYNTKLSTYATKWIKKYIRDCIPEQSRTIKRTRAIQWTLSQIAKIEDDYLDKYDRRPTEEEIAQELGRTTDGIKQLLQDRSIAFIPLDTPLPGDRLSAAEKIADEPDTDTEDNKMKEAVNVALQNLTPEEADIMIKLYGIGCTPVSARSLAERYGYSYQTVENRRCEIIRKLRYPEILSEIRGQL